MSKSFKTPTQVIYVCTGSKCKKRGGKDLSKIFRELAKGAGLKDEVEIIKTDCTDRCKYAPIVSFSAPEYLVTRSAGDKGQAIISGIRFATGPKTKSFKPGSLKDFVEF